MPAGIGIYLIGVGCLGIYYLSTGIPATTASATLVHIRAYFKVFTSSTYHILAHENIA